MLRPVEQTYKNLVSGISQQPVYLRFPEQFESQINLAPTTADGLQFRPPTVHIAALDASLFSDKPLIRIVKRDHNEKYLLMFSGTGVHVWDLQGNQKTVNYSGSTQSYLECTEPRQNLKMVSIADYSFIANTERTVAESSNVVTDVWATQGALVNVKSGQYGRTYSILLNGTAIASFTTPDGSSASHTAQIDTNYIRGQLASSLTSGGYTVTQGESWLYFTGTGVISGVVDSRDGYNNQAMFAIQRNAQKFSNLPATAPAGFTVKVLGESGSGADDYYVSFDATNRVWKECAKPGVVKDVKASDMPHTLIREADGTFIFEEAEWEPREAGDDDSNPAPSFVGSPIRDIFMWRNRLGIAAGENIVLSQSAGFFDFWVSSAIALADTDTIDQAVSHETVANIYHAIPFDEALAIFSDSVQFIGKADGVLSPKNFKLDKTTDYNCDFSVRPVGAGKNLYFISKRAEYSSLNEFYVVSDGTAKWAAQDISAHVPKFMKNGIYSLIASTGENIVLALSEGAPDTLYVYKYLFMGDTRVQTAWSRWVFEGGDILGAGFDGSELYIVIRRGDGVFLEKMLFTHNTKDLSEEPYRVILDRKTVVTPTVYDDINDATEIDLVGAYDSSLPVGTTYGVVFGSGQFVLSTPEQVTSGKMTIPGNFVGQPVIIGQLFRAEFEPSEPMLKKVDRTGAVVAETAGRLTVKRFWVAYEDSGGFWARVDRADGLSNSYKSTAKFLGAAILGNPATHTGTFEFPVQTVSTNCKITIGAEGPVPIRLTGAGWIGTYYKSSQRV